MSNRTRSTRCDGITRRSFVRIGTLGGLGMGLLDFRTMAAAETARRNNKNCILVWLDGGASHLETFDPKPLMPQEVRGPLNSIATSIPGVRFGECLPGLAKLMSQMTLLRGVTSPLGEHNLGAQYMLTGTKPVPALEYPVMGCAVSHLNPVGGDLPAHVAIPNHAVGGARIRPNGYLPSSCLPFELTKSDKPKALDATALQITGGLDQVRVDRRAEYLKRLDQFSLSLDRTGALPDYSGLDQAVRLITSPSARAAFDLEQEPGRIRNQYGQSLFGQSCLLARRMIEGGVKFVTVNYPGWDTHDNLVVRLKDGYVGALDPVGLIPNLDRGLSALIADLGERGLLEETLVVVMAEFGRTPRINALGGRDHWPRAFSVLFAGGGTPRGLVHGESDESGESPKSGAVSPSDLAATIYSLLGIDPNQELVTPDGRPVRLVGDGSVIKQLAG